MRRRSPDEPAVGIRYSFLPSSGGGVLEYGGRGQWVRSQLTRSNITVSVVVHCPLTAVVTAVVTVRRERGAVGVTAASLQSSLQSSLQCHCLLRVCKRREVTHPPGRHHF